MTYVTIMTLLEKNKICRTFMAVVQIKDPTDVGLIITWAVDD